MPTLDLPRPRKGDVLFTFDTTWESLKSALAQRLLDRRARWSTRSFAHVAIAIDGRVAFEAVPEPGPTDMDDSWTGVKSDCGSRFVSIGDLLVRAVEEGSLVVLRPSRSVANALDRIDFLSKDTLRKFGSAYSVESLRQRGEALLGHWAGAFSPGGLVARARDMASKAALSETNMTALQRLAPNAAANFQGRAYYCSQLVASVLETAGILHDVDPDITPTGLFALLSDGEDARACWENVTATHYGDSAIDALKTNTLERSTYGAALASALAMVGLQQTHVATTTRGDTLEGFLRQMHRSLDGTDAKLKRWSGMVPKTKQTVENHDDDLVDEASRDSFPASDPPSWTLGRDPH